MIRSLLASLLILAASPSFAKHWHSDGYHKRVKRVCDGKARGQRGGGAKVHAFAREANGIHCGWSYGYSNAKDARRRALRACRKNATTPCRIVYVRGVK